MSKSYILSRMDWAKAYRDYEALKVGKRNLLPEMGKQVSVGLVPSQHSNSVSDYKGTIDSFDRNGAQYFLEAKIPIKRNDNFFLSVNYSNTQSNLVVLYLYGYDGVLIDNDLINTEVDTGSMASRYNPLYKGIIISHNRNYLLTPIKIVGDNVKYLSLGVGFYDRTKITQPLTVSNWKLERGEESTPFTPSPESINASPFTVKLAEDYYNQQEEITELRNAILQLGGQ